MNKRVKKKGEFGVRVHQSLGFSRIFTGKSKVLEKKKTRYLFFPGCSLPSYKPELVENTIKYLKENLDGELVSYLGCCGKPTKILGDLDTYKVRNKKLQEEFSNLQIDYIIVACQSCYLTFTHDTKVKIISLWELIPKLGIPKEKIGIGKNSDVAFSIQDACPTRDILKIGEGVREIIKELGYKVIELEKNKDKATCCGFGKSTDREVISKIAKIRASESEADSIISYCAACRESMEIGGLDSVHLLELLFGEEYSSKKIGKRNNSLLKSWKNRYKSKRIIEKSEE